MLTWSLNFLYPCNNDSRKHYKLLKESLYMYNLMIYLNVSYARVIHVSIYMFLCTAFPVLLMVKKLPASAGDMRHGFDH